MLYVNRPPQYRKLLTSWFLIDAVSGCNFCHRNKIWCLKMYSMRSWRESACYSFDNAIIVASAIKLPTGWRKVMIELFLAICLSAIYCTSAHNLECFVDKLKLPNISFHWNKTPNFMTFGCLVSWKHCHQLILCANNLQSIRWWTRSENYSINETLHGLSIRQFHIHAWLDFSVVVYFLLADLI